MSQAELAVRHNNTSSGSGNGGGGGGGKGRHLSGGSNLRMISEAMEVGGGSDDSDDAGDDEPRLEICEEDDFDEQRHPRSQPIAIAPNVIRRASGGSNGSGSGGSLQLFKPVEGSSGYSSMSSSLGNNAVARTAANPDSDAIESLLMLGRGPVVTAPQQQNTFRQRFHSFSVSGNSSSSSSSLNQAPVPNHRRYSSGSEIYVDTGNGSQDKSQGPYYLKMRERNNEASKRCRLKRRLKAESIENQAHLLSISQKQLSARLSLLEDLKTALTEGVSCIGADKGPCKCKETVASLRRICQDSGADLEMSNMAVVENSVSCRQGTGSCSRLLSMSSDEDSRPMNEEQMMPEEQQHIQLPTIPAPKATISFPGRAELSVTPVVQQKSPQPASAMLVKSATSSPTPKAPTTALDAINDTIVKSLSNNMTSPPKSPMPLNLVKIIPQQPSPSAVKQLSFVQQPLQINARARHSSSTGVGKVIYLASPPPATAAGALALSQQRQRQRAFSVSSTSALSEMGAAVQVKCEPEIQLLKCEAPMAASEPQVDPTLTCIAAAHGNAGCSGELLELSKLISQLDLVTRNAVTGEMATSAAEKAIIMSRLRIQFWKGDDAAGAFICPRHRHDLVHSPSNLASCAMCGKKRSKKVTSPHSLMRTITYRMSLENYTRNGNILPIGLLVCGGCKEKHLKGVDFANSQVVCGAAGGVMAASSEEERMDTSSTSPPTPASVSAAMSIATIGKKPVLIKQGVVGPFGQQQAKAVDEVRVLVQPAQQQPQHRSALQLKIPVGSPVPKMTNTPLTPSVSPPSSALSPAPTSDFFAKIGRLHESLQAINPQYKPIGFSITSLESCSEGVLTDAVAATETAISTLMSVIAPGQESYLWNAVKPKLEEKLRIPKSD